MIFCEHCGHPEELHTVLACRYPECECNDFDPAEDEDNESTALLDGDDDGTKT